MRTALLLVMLLTAHTGCGGDPVIDLSCVPCDRMTLCCSRVAGLSMTALAPACGVISPADCESAPTAALRQEFAVACGSATRHIRERLDAEMLSSQACQDDNPPPSP
jgi:hypothetical protein